jgi:hypothetical protein
LIQYGTSHRSLKNHRGIKMNFFDVNSEVGSGTSPAAALNAMRLPAIALDQHGFVAEVNAAAEAVLTMISGSRTGVFSRPRSQSAPERRC